MQDPWTTEMQTACLRDVDALRRESDGYPGSREAAFLKAFWHSVDRVVLRHFQWFRLFEAADLWSHDSVARYIWELRDVCMLAGMRCLCVA